MDWQAVTTSSVSFVVTFGALFYFWRNASNRLMTDASVEKFIGRLEKAIEEGETKRKELESTISRARAIHDEQASEISQLRAELDAQAIKHRQEIAGLEAQIASLRADYQEQVARWQTKAEAAERDAMAARQQLADYIQRNDTTQL